MLGNEGQSEGHVTQRHHQRQRQIQQVGTSILQNQDDEQVIKLVEDQVDVDKHRCLRKAFISGATAIVVTSDTAVTEVAANTVPHILWKLRDRHRRIGGQGTRNSQYQ